MATNVLTRATNAPAGDADIAVRARGMTAADEVTRTLQGYADRGVFRGFSVEATAPSDRGSRRGRVSYRFSWLMRPSMQVEFDAARNLIAFRNLFPALEGHRDIAAALAAKVRERHGRDLPMHKRIDARRARVETKMRGGALTLNVQVRGRHHEYAVRHALNLVNELFLLLQETYPDYLIEHFGLSAE